MSRLMKHLLRRGQTGQSIIILAFGFVVLLGFVGIVTDVSLLFVRYSTLRRAIDSAAVAAAGQMRRTLPTTQDYLDAQAAVGKPGNEKVTADSIAYARNLATVNLAARQFIEFYGINPTNIVVETCLSTNNTDPTLCTADQRKLVRVTAQMESPTVFLRLLGWGNVTLEASAISETAVLDVVLIMDVSESMLESTTHEDWAAIPQRDGSFLDQSARIIPPRMDTGYALWQSMDANNVDETKFWQAVLNTTHPDLLRQPFIVNQPRVFEAFVENSPNNYVAASQSQIPRRTCQVRFFPNAASRRIPNGTEPMDNLLSEIRSYLGDPSYPSWYSSFVLAYNFYGCCNDPNGDGDFFDLVCQPFKQARDASLQFIKQVDFARGDRVAVVTFDRNATLLNIKQPDGTPITMIGTEDNAVDLIQRSVGVRAEDNFYIDENDDGQWDGYAVNFGEDVVRFPNPSDKTAPYIGQWDGDRVGLMADYPVFGSCPYWNAALRYPFSLYSTERPEDYDARYPTSLSALFNPIMHPNLNDSAWAALVPDPDAKANYTYELRASCAGTNMGAALREANNALLNPDTVRTNGAVWVMVMLSDGAAGASDPANTKTNDLNNTYLHLPQPYTSRAYDPDTGAPIKVPPVQGDYGVFGVCPTGTTGSPSELIKDNDAGFPFCGDLIPESRHFCFDPREVSVQDGSIYLNLENPDCQQDVYDVDDFARDWADHVGLLNPYPALEVGSVGRSDQQLPTIFTIGFNLLFDDRTTKCKAGEIYYSATDRVGDNESCLGEELLRYIADVGDNFQVDTDYQQDWRNNRQADWLLDANDDWGPRGPCEDPIIGGYKSPAEAKLANQPYGSIINPKAPGQACGNYFNATDGLELQQVFDEIAARMFTRLAR